VRLAATNSDDAIFQIKLPDGSIRDYLDGARLLDAAPVRTAGRLNR
jgi:hypothetical protein